MSPKISRDTLKSRTNISPPCDIIRRLSKRQRFERRTEESWLLGRSSCRYRSMLSLSASAIFTYSQLFHGALFTEYVSIGHIRFVRRKLSLQIGCRTKEVLPEASRLQAVRPAVASISTVSRPRIYKHSAVSRYR